jgi:hypothetical protein
MHTYASTATNPEPGNVARNAITVATAIVLAVIMTATAAVGLEAPPDHDFPIEEPLPPCEWRIPTIVVQPGGAPVEGTRATTSSGGRPVTTSSTPAMATI